MNGSPSSFFATHLPPATPSGALSPMGMQYLGTEAVDSVVGQMQVIGAQEAFEVKSVFGKSSLHPRWSKSSNGNVLVVRATIHFAFSVAAENSTAAFFTPALVDMPRGLDVKSLKKRPFVIDLVSFKPFLRERTNERPAVFGEMKAESVELIGQQVLLLPWQAEAIVVFSRTPLTMPLALAISEPVETEKPPSIRVLDILSFPEMYVTKMVPGIASSTWYTETSAFANSPKYFLPLLQEEEAKPQDRQLEAVQARDGFVVLALPTQTIAVELGGILMKDVSADDTQWIYFSPMREDGTPGETVLLTEEAAKSLYEQCVEIEKETGRTLESCFIGIQKNK